MAGMTLGRRQELPRQQC